MKSSVFAEILLNTAEYSILFFNFIRCALAQTVFDHADDHVIEAGVVSFGQGLYLGGERLRDVERLVDGLHLLFCRLRPKRHRITPL